MKNKSIIWLTVLAAIVLSGSILSSCKKKFDEPPVYIEPNITTNTTVRALRAMHTTPGSIDAITGDIIISGIVVGDDRSGNIYKQIVIQDGTAGIVVRMDATNLYTMYPVGRRVYIKAKGLYLNDYNGLIQLGVFDRTDPSNPTLGTIPNALFDNYVVKGSLNNIVTPRVVTVSQLTTLMQDTLQSTLIQLNNFEFGKGDTSATYGDPTLTSSAVNFTVKSCSGESITLRNSSYANFSGRKVAKGNGALIALASVFGSTKQLTIRGEEDVQFTGPRCSIFEEDFEGVASGADFAMAGWRNIAEVGGIVYRTNSFGGTKFVQATAFNAPGNPPVVTSWLITPAISLAGLTTPVLNFQTIDGFNNGATLTCLVSTNYNPTSNTPSTATWTTLPAAYAGPTASGYASSWKPSGNLSLAAFAGQTVYVAFRYDGANPSSGTRRTTTWEVDNIKVTRN